MSRLSATTALGPQGPRSLAIVLKRCVRSAISVFMVQQGRADYHQAKDPDPPIVCFCVRSYNSPPTPSVVS